MPNGGGIISLTIIADFIVKWPLAFLGALDSVE